jgi:hypothetical protein
MSNFSILGGARALLVPLSPPLTSLPYHIIKKRLLPIVTYIGNRPCSSKDRFAVMISR